MGLKKEVKQEIKEFIINEVFNKKNPYSAVEKYNVSRQTISKYIKELIEDGILEKVSKSIFRLKFYIKEVLNLQNKNLEEDIVYNKLIIKYENDKKENVKNILRYAFSEMLNNAIDHSEGESISIIYLENYKQIFVKIEDDGVGIFKKIKKYHNLKNENEAIFELQKGKLTSDSKNHSGEGIFFTSKVVDFFELYSFDKKFTSGNNYNFYDFERQEDLEIHGTCVWFEINKDTDITVQEIFSNYTNDEYIFDRTNIVIHLAKEYLGYPLVSRSLAKRILNNVDKFKLVFLDFDEIENIGQGFADEIFRVYLNKNPDVKIVPINQNKEVDFMIKRALNSVK